MTSGGSRDGGGVAARAALEALVARVADRDQQAFAALYDELGGAVYGVALRLLRDPAQAEEVAQEALFDVWRTAATYDPAVGSVRTWVLTVAHRRAVDRVRAVDAASRRDLAASVRDNAAAYDEVAETVEGKLDAERVRSALTALTERQREAVCLAYYGGYTHAQLADLLGLPLGTVKARVRDGLLRLRDILEGQR
jgi:RNA polymerase sigma-70 factor, ECF subfamily